MAKGIASGFPFAALGTRRELDDQWPTGSHGGTYGGNPIGCAAALATIEVLTAPGFLDNVRQRGDQLRDGLGELQRLDDGFRQVRGVGLMVASVFDDPARVGGDRCALPAGGPADPDERRHVRHGAAVDAAARRDGRRDRRGPQCVRRRAEGDGLSGPPMARLDANRVAAWRELQSVAAELERTIDEELTAEWEVPLGWFDVLAGLQRLGGSARPSDLADELRLVRSSLSRRLDRLEEEGWVARRRPADVDDHRAVVVELTAAAARCGGR